MIRSTGLRSGELVTSYPFSLRLSYSGKAVHRVCASCGQEAFFEGHVHRNESSDIADRAMKDQMTYRGFLAELPMTEFDDRSRRRSQRRIKAAVFPREKSLRAFDLTPTRTSTRLPFTPLQAVNGSRSASRSA